MDTNNYGKGGSYGKKPLWQWILIYVIVGGIVYSLVYYFVIAKKGGYTSNVPQYNPSASAPVSAPTTATPSAQESTSVSVAISNFAFSPANITVRKGTVVLWTNNDSVQHTVTGDNGGPSSAHLSQGDTYSYTFITAGSFPYHCSVHPMMKGVVQVTE